MPATAAVRVLVRNRAVQKYQGMSVGISVIVRDGAKAAHCAANCVRSAASSAESCGLVVEPLIATSKAMHVSRSEFMLGPLKNVLHSSAVKQGGFAEKDGN